MFAWKEWSGHVTLLGYDCHCLLKQKGQRWEGLSSIPLDEDMWEKAPESTTLREAPCSDMFCTAAIRTA
jgi:hypothetical protein